MKKFFSRKVLVIALGVLVVIALILRSQIPGELHEYPLDGDISLKRIDYFSHYQLMGIDDELLMDRVTRIGISDSNYVFFSEQGEVLIYMKEEGFFEQVPAEEIQDLSGIEYYKPWALTDSINDSNSLKLALKLVYFAMIILLVALLMLWFKSRK